MKKARNLFEQLNIFEKKIFSLERKIANLENQLEERIQEQRHQLLRVKNRQSLPDDFILSGKKYLDLPPEKAYKLYNDKDFDFILIDVSEEDFTPPVHFPEAIRMPWSRFSTEFLKIQSKTTPILVISEDGVRSVLACDFLAKRGFYNTNNISGGYKYWKEY
ncbi:MAG TPA: rhodanese-like domain-containing protein [Bacteriovoracaceae bacterium]|nr:rhodanese-like domain-containing protein [Bacteriovoracaceae bacterium]